MFHEVEHELNFVLWFDHNLICIVRWHLEIREANTITDVIKKSTSWLRRAFFHRPKKKKKDNSFLISSKTITHSLPFPCRKKKNTHSSGFFCFVFLWATACKGGHRCSPAKSSFTGNVFLGENDQSTSLKGSLFDVEPKTEGVWHRDELDDTTSTERLVTFNTSNSFFIKLVL